MNEKTVVKSEKEMRASQFELASCCRGSFWLNSHGSTYGTEGKAFHEALAKELNGDPFSLNELKTKYGLDDGQMNDISYALNRVQFSIPAEATIHTEHTLKGSIDKYQVKGTIDLLVENTVYGDITDYKFGRGQVTSAKNNGQLKVYVMLAFINHPNLQQIKARIIQPRIDEATEFEFDREPFMNSFPQAFYSVVDECHKNPTEYTIGSHCKKCFANMQCPAFAGEVVKMASLVSKKDLVETDEALKIMLPIAKACQIISKRIEDVAKEWVKVNGTLHITDDMTYSLKEIIKEKIKTKEAIPVLTNFFEWEDLYGIMKVAKTDLTALARKKERGLSKKVFGSLEEHGAIEYEQSERYEFTKPKPQKKEIER